MWLWVVLRGQLQNSTLWALGGDMVINLIRWFKAKCSRHQPHSESCPRRRSSDSGSDFSPGVNRHDLNQEWETMDKLALWAETEIDRLHTRLNLPDLDKN
jgi:hypothetical protein